MSESSREVDGLSDVERCLRALYLEVPAEIADDVGRTVRDALARARGAARAEGAAEALREAADAIDALHPDEAPKNSATFLRERAVRIRIARAPLPQAHPRGDLMPTTDDTAEEASRMRTARHIESHGNVVAWLDEDGYHVWFGHDCDGERVETMLPYPNWHVQPVNRDPLAGGFAQSGPHVYPSIACGRCFFHTFVPIESTEEAAVVRLKAQADSLARATS